MMMMIMVVMVNVIDVSVCVWSACGGCTVCVCWRGEAVRLARQLFVVMGC